MLTTATLMYGVGEVWEDRLEHVLKLRAAQERSLARGAGRFERSPIRRTGSSPACSIIVIASKSFPAATSS